MASCLVICIIYTLRCCDHLLAKTTRFLCLYLLQYDADTRRIKEEEVCITCVRAKIRQERITFLIIHIMVVGGLTGRGSLPLIRIPPKVKINAEKYINCVLKPYCEKFIPLLYGNETSRVFLHHDAASAHTARLTQEYAQDLKSRLGITIITNTMIPIKGPDVSPMDFFAFGFLKRRVALHDVATQKGFWKFCLQEWSRISPPMIVRVFQHWKRRLRKCHKMHGEHIENCRDIHSHKSIDYGLI